MHVHWYIECKQDLPRLFHPIHDALDVTHAEKVIVNITMRVFVREMHQRQTSFWVWTVRDRGGVRDWSGFHASRRDLAGDARGAAVASLRDRHRSRPPRRSLPGLARGSRQGPRADRGGAEIARAFARNPERPERVSGAGAAGRDACRPRPAPRRPCFLA